MINKRREGVIRALLVVSVRTYTKLAETRVSRLNKVDDRQKGSPGDVVKIIVNKVDASIIDVRTLSNFSQKT